MRRPQSAFGLAAVMAGLVVVTLSPAPAGAVVAPLEAAPPRAFDATARCTAWRSQYVPPRTVRVLRTKRAKTPRSVAGTVQEVPFQEYVAVTMAVEWPEHYPAETLRAGAIATKQFAWYYILNWRGGTKKVDGQKQCYDVVDTWVDQYYYPEKYGVGMPAGPGPKIAMALEQTWSVSLRKFRPRTQSSRFFLTGYRDGSTNVCGADANGFKLYHRSTRACGEDGWKWREILRKYLNPNLEMVTPGHHDVLGSKHGDAAAMVRGSGSQWVAHVWPSARNQDGAGSPAGVSIASDALVGFASGDVNGDGDDDLIWFRRTGASSGKIKVALSEGSGYGTDLTWWEGETGMPLAGARLLIGDFQADGRTDVALLGRGDSADKSRLLVFRRKPYGDAKKFGMPLQHWQGGHDNSKTAAAWAGDISGDGRADLIIRQNTTGGGVRIKTAVTKSPLPTNTDQRMNGLATRWENPDLKASKVKIVPGDANRDGRTDLLLLIGGSHTAKVERLQGQKLGGFKRITMWRAPKADPVSVGKTRLGSADVDYDGRSDMVMFTERGAGTRIRVLRSRYDRMVAGPDWQEGSLDWDDLRPY